MKQTLQQHITSALQQLLDNDEFQFEIPAEVSVERTRDKSHGDYATNVALVLNKQAQCAPRALAEKIVSALPQSSVIAKCEIAGPGFINFTLNEASKLAIIDTIFNAGEQFGHSDIGGGKKVQIEFVSANPTGPLHVGHGRGAAYGATVANLLAASGFEVQREYYVNDAGRQMDILATSIWMRYLDLCGVAVSFPSNGYQGDYVWDIAADLHRENRDNFSHPLDALMLDIPADEPDGGDKDIHVDALIVRAKALLGDHYRTVFDAGLNTILEDIRSDLEGFGVTFDRWYSERSLVESGAVERATETLQDAGHIYKEKGALWFRSSDFGDEKDRVVYRDNGMHTYFASDIAYHMEKFERGFEQVIDIWGADHHGYVPRVKAAIKALGENPDNFDALLVQFAILYRGSERVQMSTRSGSFVTLRELREEVGTDAARFFYVMRKCEQHMDFDLDLAKSQSNDNPVYYIQYAHARICSVMQQLSDKGLAFDQSNGLNNLNLLVEPQEQALVTSLTKFPELIRSAAINHEPHALAHYLRNLANELHSYYNAHHFIVDDANLRDARLALAIAIRQVIRNGMKLLGVSAPERMDRDEA
ncbi:MAG TPA: arginine--tRNA ligase [Ectothiorhodospiraceae bacterium]|nr:arginine--tRNA ligase [Ectothiorhodospiraceae bacterium]